MIGVLKQTEYDLLYFYKILIFLQVWHTRKNLLMYSNINHTYGKYIDISMEM